ncbi:MAG: hypothetical protein U0798_04845 [Gemmataceae bacterium]
MSFKKLVLVGAIVGVGVFALKGTKMAGHAKQEMSNLVDWAESNMISPEKEIARLRKEVSALDKDIRDVGAALAKETVEVKYLREDTSKMKTVVANEHDKIVARGQAINESTQVGTNGGKMTVATRDQMVSLDADVKRHLSRKKAYDSMQASLAAREKVKVALENQLDELKKKKIELTSDIDTIEAEYNELKYKQMESKYSFDNSRLSKIKESIQKLKKDHDIAVETMNLEPTIQAERSNDHAMTVEGILSQLNGGETEGGKVSKK